MAWGSDHNKGEFKVKWLLYLVAAYEGAVGISEIVSDTTSSTTLASLVSLPSAGNLVPSTSSLTTSGVIDLAVAGGAFYLAHKV